ncbi:hypothetical protein [Adlercreutzia sp. ZJ138]|uniref:hypothetical protein n=1 Tax=Adlercreutzia sp. ZJ138 TaxID=2709405 RepID=UPI0013EB87ED|nr:hypothetical protein [Adlercreutzia sp. ZJ138]
MARKCIVCKKELSEDSKLPMCEYHKGVAAEKAKQVTVCAGALVVGTLVKTKDTVGPVLKDKALPVAAKVVKNITRH